MLNGEKNPSTTVDRAGAPCLSPVARAHFEAVALPHLDSIYRMARALGSDAVEADDLVQETYARAYRGFGRFELREYGAKPWLLRILQNVFYTFKGRQRREPVLLEDVDFDHFVDELSWAEKIPISVGSLNWDHFDEELKSAVGRLQPEYRIALLLWSIEGLSYREIAELCECALGTVMSRLYRARRTVGRHLREYARERKLSTARFD